MEESARSSDLNPGNNGVDEEFKSCCEEDEDWQDVDESLSEEQVEDNEGFPLVIYQEQEGVDHEDLETSVMLLPEFGENLGESIHLSDGVEEIVSERSLTLLEGSNQDVVVPVCLISLSKFHDEEVLECSLGLSESEEGGVLDCEFRLREEEDDVSMESSVRLCEALGSDVSECSLQLCEVEDDISECSLTFSEDNVNDVSKSLILFENHDEDDDDDEFLVKMFCKGVSVFEDCDLGSRKCGIGVVMEKPSGVPFLQVQKKMDLFVEELVAEHLALMDGLLEALRNGCRKVLAFTDSNEVYGSITRSDEVEDQLLTALRERIQELSHEFESFVLRLASRSDLKRPLQLAQEATGIICQLIECSHCGEEKHLSKMIDMDCSHNICFDCMCVYVKSKARSSRVPVKCPQLRCNRYISNRVFRSLLPSTSLESLEGALTETEARNFWRFYCPFPDCSMLLHTHQRSSTLESSLIQPDVCCIECPECCRLVCSSCQVPWHASMRCDEYQNLPLDERNFEDIALHRLARRNSWRRCRQCREMLDLVEGCYHVSCRCGHEFCFNCGADYRYGIQTCECELRDESSESSPSSSEHATELWRWDCFNPLPSTIDGYTDQEKAQLALIQRFLAGEISLDNHNPCQSPPRSSPHSSPGSSDSYLDTIKDLNQLPWLETFISVIGDSYQEDHIY